MKKLKITFLFVLLLLYACNQNKKKEQQNKKADSLCFNAIKQDTSYKDDFSYGKDAVSSISEYGNDTLYPSYMKSKKIDTLNFSFNLKPKGNYNKIKTEIKKERIRLNKLYLKENDTLWHQQIIDSASKYITNTLINRIIPHWYGMFWDFSGYSAIPQHGSVGCSYFVSNTLLHMGFNVNRYKLAQQGPENEAKSIDINYKHYVSKDELPLGEANNKLINEILQNNKDGLYFVGISNHVGYLLVHKKELFFIHSNYGELSVMLEYAKTSEEFADYQYFVAQITYNNDLIKKWLLNEEIKVFFDK